MNNAFSTSESQKGSPDSPQSQIIALEQREEARVQAELSHMAQELRKLEDSLAQAEAEADQQARDEAMASLRALREKEIADLLRQAETDATRQADTLKISFEKEAGSLAADLAKQQLQVHSRAA